MLLMGNSTISMAIFNCYVSSPEGNHLHFYGLDPHRYHQPYEQIPLVAGQTI